MNLSKLDKINELELRDRLRKFLNAYSEPAFGAMSKREVDLLVFQLIRDMGVIDHDASAYSLMTDLRVTRSKANQLIFDSEVRKRGGDKEMLDDEVRRIIENLRFIKDGLWIIVEVENPLVYAHFKDIVRQVQHITDTSFSSSLMKITPDCLAAILIFLWGEELVTKVREKLIQEGILKDHTLKGLLVTGLLALGRRFVGDAFDDVVGKIAEEIRPVISSNTEKIIDFFKKALDSKNESLKVI